MPDVPTHPTEILAATRARAGVVAAKLAALRADLATSRGGPAADRAVRDEGVARLAAAAAALAALRELIPELNAPPHEGEPTGEAAAANAGTDSDAGDDDTEGTETHDHGRRR